MRLDAGRSVWHNPLFWAVIVVDVYDSPFWFRQYPGNSISGRQDLPPPPQKYYFRLDSFL